jgi:hypothetical protein
MPSRIAAGRVELVIDRRRFSHPGRRIALGDLTTAGLTGVQAGDVIRFQLAVNPLPVAAQ